MTGSLRRTRLPPMGCREHRGVTRNPFGFVMLLVLTLWVGTTVVRALKTGEIFSRGLYSYRRDERPFMYWMVLVIHVGIVVGFTHTLRHLD